MAESQAAPSKGGAASTAITVVIATVLALAAGASFEFFAQSEIDDAQKSDVAKTATIVKSDKAAKSDEGVDGKPDESSDGKVALTDHLIELPVIKASLVRDKAIWVRMEVAVVFPGGKIEEEKEAEIVAQLVEDTAAFVRTLTLEQLSSASGLEYLRDDLIDRARMRTDGVAQNIIIKSLLVE